MLRAMLVNGRSEDKPGRGPPSVGHKGGYGTVRPGDGPRAGTSVTLARMNSIQRINQALAQLVASLNVVAAVLIVLLTAAAGYTWAGIVGIIVGVVVGTVFAGVVCGVLALLINIRDLLADSLTPRP